MIEYQFNNRIDLSDLQQSTCKIKVEIAKYIVGQPEMVELLLIALLADGHVLLEGVPGVAKTLCAKLLAKTIQAEFKRIQFTPDLMPSDIIGTSIFNTKNSEFEFRKGPLFSNIILADEINRSPAKTQSALFEAMEERQITTDGNTYVLDTPFLVLATQNPIEQEGTYRLPEAQLDRFLFKIEVNYPSMEEETEILKNFHERKNIIDLNTIEGVLKKETIKIIRQTVCEIHVDTNLLKYISRIVNGTRNNTSLFLGASPRASIAILNASKSAAAIRGRDFITPDDIKFVAPHVLKHRIILTPEKEMEGVTANEVIKQLLEDVEIPR
jgi:MoxR-like ATPase